MHDQSRRRTPVRIRAGRPDTSTECERAKAARTGKGALVLTTASCMPRHVRTYAARTGLYAQAATGSPSPPPAAAEPSARPRRGGFAGFLGRKVVCARLSAPPSAGADGEWCGRATSAAAGAGRPAPAFAAAGGKSARPRSNEPRRARAGVAGGRTQGIVSPRRRSVQRKVRLNLMEAACSRVEAVRPQPLRRGPPEAVP